MLNFGNKEFRNLQEQVLKNMQDIDELKQLSEVGIGVDYVVESLEDIEEPEQGQVAAVGEDKPYELYAYVVVDGEGEWVDLGQFPMPGPQGIQGVQGPVGPVGPAGSRGPKGDTGEVSEARQVLKANRVSKVLKVKSDTQRRSAQTQNPLPKSGRPI